MDALIAGTASTSDFLVAWFGAWAPMPRSAPSSHSPSCSRPAGCRGAAVAGAIAPSSSPPLRPADCRRPTFTLQPRRGRETTIPNRFAVLPELPLWQIGAVVGPAPGPDRAPGRRGRLTAGPLSPVHRRAAPQLRWLLASIAFVAADRDLRPEHACHLRRGHRGPRVDPAAIVAYPDGSRPPIGIAILALPPVRDRPDRQPDDRLGRRDRRPGGGVRRADRRCLQAVLAPVTEENTLAVAASTLRRVRAVPAASAGGSSAPWTGASTAPGTTASGPSPRSPRGCATEVDLDASSRRDRDTSQHETVRPACAAVWLRNVRTDSHAARFRNDVRTHDREDGPDDSR